MTKMIKFPKIGQFRQAVREVRESAKFHNHEPPKLTFTGTVKLHGTNAGVSFNRESGIWAQSRNNVISLQNDNAGFAFFVDNHGDWFSKALRFIVREHGESVDDTATIYGEWCGKGIQNKVGISKIEKSFFIFGIKVTPSDDSKPAYWVCSLDSIQHLPESIFKVNDFKTFEVEIDFSNPAIAQNEMAKLTMEVEAECPVSKSLNPDSDEHTGEGIVWNCGALRFKTKGDKHSATRVKTIKEICPEDIAKMESVSKFIAHVVTDNRLNQAIENVFSGESPTIKKMGEVIRWVYNDVVDEESDTMRESGIEPSDVGKGVSNAVRPMFIKVLDSLAGVGNE